MTTPIPSVYSEETRFLSAGRSSRDEVLAQARRLVDDPLLKSVVDSSKAFIAVLNRNRQVIFANSSFVAAFDADTQSALGLRPGELAGCSRVFTAPSGCGTAEECATCGAAIAIRSAQLGVAREEECRILRDGGDPIDLEVTATPFVVAGEDYTLFTALDIGDRKRRRALERIFFHDILNAATGVQGLSGVARMAEEDEKDELLGLIEFAAGQLIDEIQGQRELLAAETNELAVHPKPVRATDILAGVAGVYESHEVGTGKHILVDPASAETMITTDATLLGRVLVNLVKNALEATRPDGTVTIGCTSGEATATFTVHNEAEIPEAYQHQIFQRSFTTKGNGRGLGTYGARLLTERYLGGSIAFHSNPESGTTFAVTYPLFLAAPIAAAGAGDR